MEEFAGCTKRGERSSRKLYKQEFVHGTRDAEKYLWSFAFIEIAESHAKFLRGYPLWYEFFHQLRS